jgi:uncharacterized protein YciI
MARRPPGVKSVSPAAAVAEQPAKKPVAKRAAALKDTPAAEPAPEAVPPPAPTPMATPAPGPAPAAKPAGKLFSVTRSRGSGWESSQPQEQQAEWAAHAAFMNGLEAEGFVVLGGPLEETPYILLAVRAADVSEVRGKLAQDPWEANRVLETTRIVGWTLALGDGKI